MTTHGATDETTVQFQFSLSTLAQLEQRLRKHSLYPFAIDLLSKNRLQPDLQLLNAAEKVRIAPSSVLSQGRELPLDLQSTVYHSGHLHPLERRRAHSRTASRVDASVSAEIRTDHGLLLLSAHVIHRRNATMQSSISVSTRFATTRKHGLLRFPYRLYYCLKEFEDRILIQLHPVAQHILHNSLTYTAYSSM